MHNAHHLHTATAHYLALARVVAPLNLSYEDEMYALKLAADYTTDPAVLSTLATMRNALASASALEVALDSVDESDDENPASAARAWGIVLETLRGLK